MSGRLESGHVQVGQSVLIQPANEVATVKGTSPYTITLATVTMVMGSAVLSVSEGQSSWAAAGDQVILTLIGSDSSKVR